MHVLSDPVHGPQASKLLLIKYNIPLDELPGLTPADIHGGAAASSEEAANLSRGPANLSRDPANQSRDSADAGGRPRRSHSAGVSERRRKPEEPCGRCQQRGLEAEEPQRDLQRAQHELQRMQQECDTLKRDSIRLKDELFQTEWKTVQLNMQLEQVLKTQCAVNWEPSPPSVAVRHPAAPSSGTVALSCPPSPAQQPSHNRFTFSRLSDCCAWRCRGLCFDIFLPGISGTYRPGGRWDELRLFSLIQCLSSSSSK